MSLQEEIQKRQNEKPLLRCQFVARWYYNLAETANLLAFIFSIASALLVLIPESDNETISAILLLLPTFLGIASIVSYRVLDSYVKSASELRNYFDHKVTGVVVNEYSEHRIRSIRERVENIVKRHREECKIQIATTGRDTPPGVRDWYEFARLFPDSEVVIECQRQNQWWNNKLLKLRVCLYATVFLVSVVGTIMISLIGQLSLLRCIACFFSIVVTFSDRIVENIKYIIISKKIDWYFEIPSLSKNPDQIKTLQELICSRRRYRVTEINLFHKKRSKSLSEEYEQISRRNG